MTDKPSKADRVMRERPMIDGNIINRNQAPFYSSLDSLQQTSSARQILNHAPLWQAPITVLLLVLLNPTTDKSP